MAAGALNSLLTISKRAQHFANALHGVRGELVKLADGSFGHEIRVNGKLWGVFSETGWHEQPQIVLRGHHG